MSSIFQILFRAKTLIVVLVFAVILFFLSTFSSQWGVTNGKKTLNDLTPVVKRLKESRAQAFDKCPLIIKKLQKSLPDLTEKNMTEDVLKSHKLIYDCQFMMTDYKGAVSSLAKLSEAEPQVARWYGLAAEALYEDGQAADAVRKAHLATQLEPNNYKWFHIKARALFKLHQYDASIKAFKSAIAVVPFENSQSLIAEYEEAEQAINTSLEHRADS